MTDLAVNRKARFHFEILETVETGIVLRGTEVKSCRAHKISLQEASARLDGGEIWLHGAHVAPYEAGNVANHDPIRPRKLLLHRVEIDRIGGMIAEKRLRLVPLRMYLKKGRIKLEIGLGKGRLGPDKRELLRKRDADRQAERDLSERRKD